MSVMRLVIDILDRPAVLPVEAPPEPYAPRVIVFSQRAVWVPRVRKWGPRHRPRII